MMYELGQHVSTLTFEVNRGHPVHHQVLVDVAPVHGQLGQSHDKDMSGQPQGKDICGQIGQSPHDLAEVEAGMMHLPDGHSLPVVHMGRAVNPVTWLYYGYVLWFY